MCQGTKTTSIITLDIRHTKISLIPQMASVGATNANAVAIRPSLMNNLVISTWNGESGFPVPWWSTTTIEVKPTNAIDSAAKA